MQLWKEAAVSVWISGTDSEHLSRRLGDNNENGVSSLSSELATDRGMELTAENDDLGLRLRGVKGNI